MEATTDSPASSKPAKRGRRTRDPRVQDRIDFVTCGAIKLLGAIFQCFPIDANLLSGRLLGLVWFYLGPTIGMKHRRRAMDHIAASFPGMPEREVARIARESMVHLAQLAIEMFFTTRLLTPTTWHRHVRLEPMDQALQLLLTGRPVIMCTGHFGNWELLGYTLACMGFRVHAVMRPLDNPYLNDWLESVRARRGLVLLHKKGMTEQAESLLGGRPARRSPAAASNPPGKPDSTCQVDKPPGNASPAPVGVSPAPVDVGSAPMEGDSLAMDDDPLALPGDPTRRGGVVAFIADQDAGAKGIFVDFFGRPASTYRSIGLLAMHYDAPIIVGSARRLAADRFRYGISVERVILPHEWQEQPNPLRWITEQYTQAIELAVRRAPEQYLWVHRRWKHQPQPRKKKAPASRTAPVEPAGAETTEV